MRDDLHKTVTLRKHWKRAVRAAGQSDEAEASAEIHRASYREWDDGVRTEWFERLAQEVARSRASLFHIESVFAVVDSFEQSARTALERNVCEVFRQVVYGGAVDKLEGAVRSIVISDCARSGIEHCALSVAEQFGDPQSQQLRRAMTRRAADVDFTSAPVPRSKKKLGIDDMLSLDIRLGCV
ncbi:hypothetical protein [Burkholderia gladioli]|uniref:Uncharacterized protein n=1 Tax=Burkholderia gladioli (strain BSR3) TaxID=999541 RepID=F2LB63_BURGS|nr:hypothetical protein [Burkholderia gladioli]AEA60132.1 hypothetical protein bgla_1g14620 [Burkholderia gladioli BSR3]